jgi:hypothetical protein
LLWVSVLTFLVVTVSPGDACTSIVEDWAPALTLASGSMVGVRVHDMLVWNDRLWIAQGSGQKAAIRSYDEVTETLTNEFVVPPKRYTGAPYWRALKVFDDSLYAGLGNNFNVRGTGDVYRFDGVAWTRVLDTTENDVYALEVYNGKLYAGLGSDGTRDGKLYESTDGVRWKLIKTFPSDFVRSLREWNGRLYIGLRNPGRLWSYDGRRFIDLGAPHRTSQMKSLVPYLGKLYIGAVPAKVLSWDGLDFKVELDATQSDREIYKGVEYAGCLYFPTNSRGDGGRVWKFDGSIWVEDYVDEDTTNQLQVVVPYAGYLWVGGGQRARQPLTLRRTLQEQE